MTERRGQIITKVRQLDRNWLLLALLSAFALAPLLHPLYFWGAHDARHSVYFLVEFDRAIQDGILYPRWSPDFAFGYGYPIFNINAPLAYFVAEFWHLLGFDFVTSVKIVFGLSFLLGGFGMYLLARDIAGRLPALMAGVIYVYVPYHLVEVYVRGALAESLATAFVPFAFWTVRRLIVGIPAAKENSAANDAGEETQERDFWQTVPYSLACAVALAALLMTHNQIAMFTAPLLAIYAAYLILSRALTRNGEVEAQPNKILSHELESGEEAALTLTFSQRERGLEGSHGERGLESGHGEREIESLDRGRERRLLPVTLGEDGGEGTVPHIHASSELVDADDPNQPSRWSGKGLVEGLRRQRLLLVQLCLAGVLALTLSAIFWLPMVTEFKFVRTDQWITADYDYRDHFVYLNQLFSPFWSFGVSKPGPDDGMPFQLGVIPVTLALLVLGRRREDIKGEYVFFGLVTLGAVFLMQPSSASLWALLGIAPLIQFPWRLLAVSAFSLSILATFALRGRENKTVIHYAALAALLLGTIWASFGYLSPQLIEPAEGPVSLAGLMRFQQSSGELVGLTKWNKVKPTESPLLPLYLSGQPITSKVAPESLAPGAKFEARRHTTVLDEVTVSSAEGTPLTFYTQYYPGWQTYLDGRPLPFEVVGDYGLIKVLVPSGEHTVALRFETTTPRLVGTLLTLFGAVAALALITVPLSRVCVSRLRRVY